MEIKITIRKDQNLSLVNKKYKKIKNKFILKNLFYFYFLSEIFKKRKYFLKNILIRNMSSSKNYSFVAEFVDAYSFRNLIEYLKCHNDEIIFIFTKDVIFCKRANKQMELINEIIINTKELVNYEFNEEENFSVGLDLTEFKESLGVGKKDSVRILCPKKDNCIIIQYLTHTGSYENNGQKVSIKKVEEENFELDEYKRAITDPNFVVPLINFTKSCKPLNTDCTYVNFYQYNKGLKIEKIGSGSNVDKFQNFGIVNDDSIMKTKSLKIVIKDDSDNKMIDQTKIRSTDVKNFSKLNNISTNTNIRFYFEKDIPIRLSYNIGCYGSLIVHILGATEK